jgi:hypothetical protein
MTLPRPSRPRPRAVKIPRPLFTSQHAIFAALLKQEKIPMPTTELRFAEPRRWRFDYAWPNATVAAKVVDSGFRLVAVEVEGGAFTRGRHTRGKGFIADMEKYNEAAVRGWIVLRVTPQQLCTMETVELIRRAPHPLIL